MGGRKLRIVVMDSRYFGHQTLEPEVFWDEWQTAVERGDRSLWFACIGPRSSAINPYLWDLSKKKLPVLPSWFVTSIAHWKVRFEFRFIDLRDASIYRLNFLTVRATSLPLEGPVSARRHAILDHLDEPVRPYVVFTVREFDSLDQENDLSNRRIIDLHPGMSELVSRGFNVIRLMSKTKDPLTVVHPNLLDWQVERDGEPGDELALMSGAAFVVSTTTGGDCLALAYRRPVLYLDCFRFPLVFLGTELATFSVPLMCDSHTGDRLGLSEILDRGLGWVGDQRLFARAGVLVSQSDPQRIRTQIAQYAEGLSVSKLPNRDPAQQLWRDLLVARLGSEIVERHGEIRANMLRSCIPEFVT